MNRRLHEVGKARRYAVVNLREEWVAFVADNAVVVQEALRPLYLEKKFEEMRYVKGQCVLLF